METRVVDDLGRVSIPKEIRADMKIRVGDRLNIESTESGSIIITPCYPSYKMVNILNDICSYLKSVTNLNIVIVDRERILASDNELNHYSCNLPIWYERYINQYPNSFETESEFSVFDSDHKLKQCSYSGSVFKLNADNKVEFGIVILNGEKEIVNRKMFDKFVNIIDIIIKNFTN